MKPYAPSPEAAAPALVVVPRDQGHAWRFHLTISPEYAKRTREEAEQWATKVANAIADDVHGAELAVLRARIEEASALASSLFLSMKTRGDIHPAEAAIAILAALKGPPA